MFRDFFYNCFYINLKDYENIGIDLEINRVLLVAFIALAIGVIFLNIYRKNMRIMVMQLIRHEALTPDNGKMLDDLGLHNNRILKLLLSSDGMLTKIVGRVGEPEYTYEEYIALDKKKKKEKTKIDFNEARFYIRDEKRERADTICEKYDTSTFKIILSCIFIFIAYICILSLMPQILSWINYLLKDFKM